jgi:hypothetical protein
VISAPRSRCRARALLLALLIAGAAVRASDTVRTDIRFDGPTYEYTFVAVLAAPSSAVTGIVTDYDRLARINDDIVESRVLERQGEGALKRLLALRHCLLVFCFEMRFVETVEEAPGHIVTTVVPAESNFADGRSEWRIEDTPDGATRISVNARQTPKFWIPPVIGPLLLRHVFVREVEETCSNIERLAQATLSGDA